MAAATLLIALPFLFEAVWPHDLCSHYGAGHWLYMAGAVASGVAILWFANKAVPRVFGCLTMVAVPLSLFFLADEWTGAASCWRV